MPQITLECRGVGCGRKESFTFADGVPWPADYLCRHCEEPKSMLDDIDWSDLGRTRLARRVAWQRTWASARPGCEREDRYVVYRRLKDTARRFRRRNGFTIKEWHARVDRLGWRCTSCGCHLTKTTVVRRSVDGSKKLESQVPVCRSCHCRRVGDQGALSQYI